MESTESLPVRAGRSRKTNPTTVIPKSPTDIFFYFLEIKQNMFHGAQPNRLIKDRIFVPFCYCCYCVPVDAGLKFLSFLVK